MPKCRVDVPKSTCTRADEHMQNALNAQEHDAHCSITRKNAHVHDAPTCAILAEAEEVSRLEVVVDDAVETGVRSDASVGFAPDAHVAETLQLSTELQ